ncbi:MAG: SBBP repeat-containing protein [Bacteroidales bacterium]|nr:SBBP repeat-containing protein [Bacteroidales bacterium]
MKNLSFLFCVLTFVFLSAEKKANFISILNGCFIENKGQWSPDVLFMGKAKDATVWILRKGIGFDYLNADSTFKRVIFYWKSAKDPLIASFGRKEGTVNYIRSNQRIQANVFSEILLHHLYPGVDVRYYFEQGFLRFDLIIHPWGNCEEVSLILPEEISTVLNSAGELIMSMGDGEIHISSPLSYLQKSGKQIESSFDLEGNLLKIDVQKTNRNSEVLIIDPLIYSTYLGGNQYDYAMSISVDSFGNAFLVGNTRSTNFDTTLGSYQTSLAGQSDLFVTKINPSSNSLVYSTYIGGSGNDYGYDIAINSNGEAFVVGYSSSTDYPITSGVIQNTFAGIFDVVVTALNSSGTDLLFSTYLGGSNEDIGYGIYIDGAGKIYLTGITNSTNFDITPGAFQTTLAGNYDVFVTKMGGNGTSLIYSTYLGGTQADYGSDIAVDMGGYVYVTGQTYSSNFDVTGTAYQTNLGGGVDAFLTKINPTTTGNSLVFSTFLGGSNNDIATALEVDQAGCSYIVGQTNSSNFDVTSDAFQLTFAGQYDGFFSKFSSNGSQLLYSTYLGGNDLDYINDIMLDSLGFPNLIGETRSTNFPVTLGAFQTNKDNGYDICLTRLDPSGKHVLYATYLGGNNDDYGRAIQKGPGYSVYLTGYTNSTNYDITSVNYQNLPQGMSEVIFTKLKLCPNINISIVSNSPLCWGDTLSMHATFLNGYNYRWVCPNNMIVNDTIIHIPNVDTSFAGLYYLIVTDSFNACSYQYQTVVQVLELPQVEILLPDDSFCLGSVVQFSVTDPNMASYEWYGPEGFHSNEIEPSVSLSTFEHAGMYYLYVTNHHGCVGVDSLEIYVIDCTQLPDMNNFSQFSVMPNPTRKNLTIYSSKMGKISIYNEEGRKIKEFYLDSGTYAVSLPSGKYQVVRENDRKAIWVIVQ